jgi:asparagine synthase (glutamine-hydrolysing)
MCGIAGFISADREVATATTRQMTESLMHRGPDDSGCHTVGFGRHWLGLGHRRLSILDLSPNGHQPMVDSERGNVLVFNGEIYNFAALRRRLEQEGARFRGTGDSEVLLSALSRWGVETTLKSLEGMYAFAFFDAGDETLSLARDPLGIKPLYLATKGQGGFAFASEVRGVLKSGAIDRKLDRNGVAGFLAFGALQHPLTLFEEIRSLTPGSYRQIRVSSSGWSATGERRFWNFPSLRDDARETQVVEEVRKGIDRAVHDHLVSDVPVGILLSAGLDSTVIAAAAARQSHRLTCFTVGFSDNRDLSEAPVAARTATEFGLDYRPVDITTHDAEEAAAAWLAAVDQPSIDGLNTFIISRAIRAAGVKVALSGLGADELFGGYPSFREVPKLLRLRRALRGVGRPIRSGVAAAMTLGRPRTVREKLSEMLTGPSQLEAIYFHRRRAMSDAEMSELGFDGWTFEPHAWPGCYESDFGRDPLAAISRLETRFYQGNMLLRDSDAMSMAHGLELRVPFLDRRLLELVHAVPGRVRLTPGKAGKHLLRRAFSDSLRPELTSRRKTGFTLPISRWMRGPLSSTCDAGLTALKGCGLIRPSAVDAIWQRFLSAPETPAWSRAFALVALGDYIRRQVL